MTVGARYDVKTTDGTVYANASLLEVKDDGSIVISYGIAVVFVAQHELAGMTEART